MKNKTFILELAVRDEEGKLIHSINVTDFRLEETGLCFFDSMLKESKEILFNILREKYYKNSKPPIPFIGAPQKLDKEHIGSEYIVDITNNDFLSKKKQCEEEMQNSIENLT
jgi:hypothetical protein